MKTPLIKQCIALLGIGIIFLSGCSPVIGPKVEVPPAHVGKILTKDGYKPETVMPSKFRLERCFAYCDKMILLEASDQPQTETFELFMPKDQLNMSFDVRMTLAIDNDKIDEIFDRVPAQNNKIEFARVYGTYAKPIIRDIIRQKLTGYTINEVASSRQVVSAELDAAVREALIATPFKMRNLGLADVQFPPVITQAKIKAAERREEIEREKAQLELQRVTMERNLEEAQMQRAIDREKAEATKEVNDILALSVTDKYLAYRSLEVLEKLAESENKVFVPMEAVGTLGLQQAIFQQEMKRVSKPTTTASTGAGNE